MQYNLIIRPEAETDLTEIFTWYESKRKGIGHRFLFQINTGFEFIVNNPKLLRKVYTNVRRYIVKKFPYKIYYKVIKDKIIILAVLYSGRNSVIINKRIKI
jgi:toxin ParE1/3/4